MSNTHPILIIEDSPEDFFLISKALKKASVENMLIHCRNGEEALEYLRIDDGSNDDPLPKDLYPSLILLDLRMPDVNGRDILKAIKSNPDYATIPVVMLTGSDQKEDIDACYALGANSYIEKPLKIQDFEKAVLRLKSFLLDTSTGI